MKSKRRKQLKEQQRDQRRERKLLKRFEKLARSGYHIAQGLLPIGLHNRIDPAQVPLCSCDTDGERRVAVELSAIWRELQRHGSRRFDTSWRERQGRAVAIAPRYAEEQEILEQLDSVWTLGNLRRLLNKLRDRGALARLARSAAAGAAEDVAPAAAGQPRAKQQQPQQQPRRPAQQQPEQQPQRPPQQQQEEQQEQQEQEVTFQVRLHVRADENGVPDAKQRSTHWVLITASTAAEAALVRDLASAWRAAHGKRVKETKLLRGQEVQQRLSQVLPAVVRKVLEAGTIPQMQSCLEALMDSGELQRAAARLDLSGAAEAPGAQRSAAQQAAAPRPATAETPGAEGEQGGSSGQGQLLPKKRAAAWPATQGSEALPSKRAAVVGDGGSRSPFPTAAPSAALHQAPGTAAQGRPVQAAAAAPAQQGPAHDPHHTLDPLVDQLPRQPPQTPRFSARTGWTAELIARLAQMAGDPAYLAPGSSSSSSRPRPDWGRIGEVLGCTGSSASSAYYKMTHAGQPGADAAWSKGEIELAEELIIRMLCRVEEQRGRGGVRTREVHPLAGQPDLQARVTAHPLLPLTYPGYQEASRFSVPVGRRLNNHSNRKDERKSIVQCVGRSGAENLWALNHSNPLVHTLRRRRARGGSREGRAGEQGEQVAGGQQQRGRRRVSSG